MRFVRFGFKLLFLLVGLGACFTFAMFQGGFVSWFLFFSFIPIFVYLFVFLVYPLQTWRIDRNLSSYLLHAGDTVTVTLHIKRPDPLPFYFCLIEEQVPIAMDRHDTGRAKYRYLENGEALIWRRTMKRLLFPGWRRQQTVAYSLDDLPRGEHVFRVIRVTLIDLLGFTHKTRYVSLEDELLVYPARLPVLTDASHHRNDNGQTQSQVWLTKPTSIVAGSREYVPGDKFSWIDWKQTARRNTVMTKEFDQEKNRDTLIVLNHCHDAGNQGLVFEAMVEMGLTIAETVVRKTTNTRFMTVGDKQMVFELERGTKEMARLEKYLTTIQISGEVTFTRQLKKMNETISQASLIALLVPSLDESLKELVYTWRKRGGAIAIYLVSPENEMTMQTYRIIKQLRFQGVNVHVLTEKALVGGASEVSQD